jgi:hypothetical protein
MSRLTCAYTEKNSYNIAHERLCGIFPPNSLYRERKYKLKRYLVNTKSRFHLPPPNKLRQL